MSNKSPFKIACGARLRRARLAVKVKSQKRLADLTGESEHNISKWESGGALIPPHYVQKLRELYGITHDWIYANEAGSLSHDLRLSILNVNSDDEPD